MAHFSDRLKLLRREHNLSQMELARQLGCVSKSSVNMYERGEREPSFETLEAIADYFNVDLDYLLGKSDVPNRYRSLIADIVESNKSGRRAAEDEMRRVFGTEHATLSTHLCEDKSKASVLYYRAVDRRAAPELSGLITMVEGKDFRELEKIRRLVSAYLNASEPIREIVDTALKPYDEEDIADSQIG